MAWGRAGSDDGQQRLVFPLLAEPTPRPHWVVALIAGAAIVALLALAVLAASHLRPSAGKLAVAAGTSRDDGSQPERAEGRRNLSVSDLEPGTCLEDYAAGTDVREVQVVPCSVAHEAEVVASRRMPEGRWPGRDGIDDFAAERCVRAIRAAGVPPTRALKWSYVGPSATGWSSNGDRVVNCLVVSADEPLIGSLLADTDDGGGREDDS